MLTYLSSPKTIPMMVRIHQAGFKTASSALRSWYKIKTSSEIGQFLGVSNQTVRKLLKLSGVKMKKRGRAVNAPRYTKKKLGFLAAYNSDANLYDLVTSLKAGGVTYAEMSRKSGLNESTIRTWLKNPVGNKQIIGGL